MNIELKFKAWDKEKKRMSLPFTLGQQPLIQWEDEPLTLMPTMFAEAKSSRFVFLQYTGLNDKFDNELYDGDVCFCNKEYYEVCLQELGGAWKLQNLDTDDRADDKHFLLNEHKIVELSGNFHSGIFSKTPPQEHKTTK